MTLGRFLLFWDPFMQLGLPDLFDSPGNRNLCGASTAASLAVLQGAPPSWWPGEFEAGSLFMGVFVGAGEPAPVSAVTAKAATARLVIRLRGMSDAPRWLLRQLSL